MSKLAAGGIFGQLLKDPQFWAPVAATGLGLAATGGTMAAQKVLEARAQAKAYKEMLDLHPQLKKRDQGQVKRIFSSLHNVNPMLSRDPTVSGAWVDTIMESGGLDSRLQGQALLTGVKELAGIRASLAKAKHEEGGRAHAIGGAVKHLTEPALKGFGEAKAKVEAEEAEQRMGRGTKMYEEAARQFAHAGGSPEQAQQILDAIVKKHSSAKPGKLLAAVLR